MKIKKGILSFVFAFCLLVPAFAFLTGCSCEDKSTAVVSINTNSGTSLISANNNSSNKNAELLALFSTEIQLDLVVDANNKVVCVTAKNANADQLVASVDLNNINIDEAINKIVENSMLEGNIKLFGSSINVSINGDSQELLNTIDTKVNTTITNLQNKYGLDLTKTIEKLESGSEKAKAELAKKLEYLAPELTSSEIKNLTQEEIMAQIKAKSIELKDITYANFNSLMAQFDVMVGMIKDQLETLGDLVPEQVKTQFNEAIEDFNEFKATKIEEFKAAYAQVKEQMITAHNNLKAEIKATLETKLEQQVTANELSQEAMNAWLELFGVQTNA